MSIAAPRTRKTKADPRALTGTGDLKSSSAQDATRRGKQASASRPRIKVNNPAGDGFDREGRKLTTVLPRNPAVGPAAGAVAGGAGGAPRAAQPKKGLAGGEPTDGSTPASRRQREAAGGELGPDRTIDVTRALETGKLDQAVEAALNSPHDRVALQLEVEVGLGAGANKSIRATANAELWRRPDGKFELSLEREVALALGLKTKDLPSPAGVDANAHVGASHRLIYEFDDPADAAKGVGALALTASGLGDTPAAAEAAAGVVKHATSEDTLAGKAVREVAGVAVKSAQGPLGLLPGVARRAEEGVDRLFDAVHEDASQVERFAGELADAKRLLDDSLAAVELRVEGGVAGELSWRGTPLSSEPPLALEGTAALGTSVRFNLPRDGKPESIWVTQDFAAEGSFHGRHPGTGLGASASSAPSLQLRDTFEIRDGAVVKTDSLARFDLDYNRGVRGSSGLAPGLTADAGSSRGSHLRLDVAREDLDRLGPGALRELMRGDVERFAELAGSLPVQASTWDYQRRSVHGEYEPVADVGTGLSAGTDLGWSDAGPVRTIDTTIGELVRDLAHPLDEAA